MLWEWRTGNTDTYAPQLAGHAELVFFFLLYFFCYIFMYSFLFIMFLSMDLRAFIFNGVSHISNNHLARLA